MKVRNTSQKKRGFTLVELLTVIAIIGILAAILIPTVGSVMKKARITSAGSNARQICQAYNIYAISGPRIKNISSTGTWPSGAKSVAEWAGVLAIYGGLDDGTFYFVSDDNAITANTLPKSVLTPGAATPTVDTPFATAVNSYGAYSVVVNMPRGASATTAPIMWTRGLSTSTGQWSATSPWGTEGGHIGYLDGHVTWQRTTFEEDANGDLRNAANGNPTKNVEEAAGITAADVLSPSGSSSSESK